jgi:fumarylacetoacetase
VHATGSLNAFLAQGPVAWHQQRARLTDWLTDPSHRGRVERHLAPRAGATMHLPVEVADYVDFYSSQHHAENLGRMFRPGDAPLTRNWKHLPIGYHGRAGTVRVSGTPVVRPSGQRKAPADDFPTFGPSQRLDIEAEAGFIVGTPSELGRPVPVSAFPDHVFGVCLVNDWSAGPAGLGVRPAGSVPGQVLPHLRLAVDRSAPGAGGGADQPTGPRSPAAPLPRRRGRPLGSGPHPRGAAQRGADQPPAVPLALLDGGSAARAPDRQRREPPDGDLYASGTVSGPAKDERGSLIELSWGGSRAPGTGRRHHPHVPRGRRPRLPDRDSTGPRRQPDLPRRGHRPSAAGRRAMSTARLPASPPDADPGGPR